MDKFEMTCRHCGKPARYNNMRIFGLENGEQLVAAMYRCDDCNSEEMLRLFLHKEFAMVMNLHPSETKPVRRKTNKKLRIESSYVCVSSKGESADTARLMANRALTNCIKNTLGDSFEYRYSKRDKCIYLYEGTSSRVREMPGNQKNIISIGRAIPDLLRDFGYGYAIASHSVEPDGSIKVELEPYE